MCGICGVAHRDPSWRPDERDLLRMRDVIAHRGPDDAGLTVSDGVALGSRRLAILDLSERGHMPMRTPDGRFTIVYNGEVYNADALRQDLIAKGYAFRSRTDTEVVLTLYADEGPRMLDRLNGMFAMAIWDARDRTLFLARDRLGIKPLYYAVDAAGERLCFASEQKALFAFGLRPQFDETTWPELLCFRFVAGERTPFAGVRRLLPGHYLTWCDGEAHVTRWWNLEARARAHTLQSDLPGWFRETFDDAVQVRRISDVPVGVLLSGGLDSSSVAASLAQHCGDGVASFTVTFAEAGYDEGPLAREVSRRWHLTPHELSVPTAALLPRLLRATWLNDEPLVHGNELHLWAISEYAKPLVTVLLSGEGADETLGGYVRYRPLRHPALLALARTLAPRRALERLAEGRLRKLARMLALGSTDAFVLFDACDVLPDDLRLLGADGAMGDGDLGYRRAVLDEARRVHPGEPLRQAMYSDQHTFLCSLLDRNDRMTMGASIECRVPFLDYRLVEQLAAAPTAHLFPDRQSKAVLRRAVGDRLPEAVLTGRKWGFGVPWAMYLRSVPELREVVADLPHLSPIREGPFETRAIERVTKRFLDGDVRMDALVRQLVMVALWHRACVASWSAEGTPVPAPAAQP